MTFLINDCYHKMCASCVSRRFGLGPAECPYPTCHLVLRKHKFRAQTFPDLKVEREVDVRKRVKAVFNRREEDFETLREWNDYLEEVERITFELLDDDVETRKRAERELVEHATANKKAIERNVVLEKEDKENVLSRAEVQRKQTLAARKAAAMEIEDQKAEVEEIKRARVRILAETRNPAEARKRIAEETRKIKVRREKAREKARREVEEEFGGGGGKRRRIADEEAFEPAKGVEWESRWFVVREDYDVPYVPLCSSHGVSLLTSTQLARRHQKRRSYPRRRFPPLAILRALPLRSLLGLLNLHRRRKRQGRSRESVQSSRRQHCRPARHRPGRSLDGSTFTRNTRDTRDTRDMI